MACCISRQVGGRLALPFRLDAACGDSRVPTHTSLMFHASRSAKGGLAVGLGASGTALWAQRNAGCHRSRVSRTRRPQVVYELRRRPKASRRPVCASRAGRCPAAWAFFGSARAARHERPGVREAPEAWRARPSGLTSYPGPSEPGRVVRARSGLRRLRRRRVRTRATRATSRPRAPGLSRCRPASVTRDGRPAVSDPRALW